MIYCRIRSHLIDLMGKKPAKDDDRLQNALSVRSGLKLFFFLSLTFLKVVTFITCS